MRFIAIIAGALMMLGAAGTARAASIEYDFVGTGTYTLGTGLPITGAFKFALLGDTTNVVSNGPYKTNSGLTGTFYTGTYNLNSDTYTWLSSTGLTETNSITLRPGSSAIWYSQLIQSVNVTTDTLTLQNRSGSLSSYDLKTPFSPIYAQYQNVNFASSFSTSSGDLSFSQINSLTFSAASPAVLGTPGPVSGASLSTLLLLAGMFMFVGRRSASLPVI